jgi:hypothetical protein
MITQVAADIRFDRNALRPASTVSSFPWLVNLVTLVRVTPDGVVTQAKSDAEKRAMLGEADEQDLVLAAWPGEWSQDVFVVDDLKGARVSVGLPRHKATPAAASQPHGRAAAQRNYTIPVSLWQRLAESSGLSPEGQRQIAAAQSSHDVALALLARPDLDEEARQQVLKGDGYAVPETLVASGRLTSDEIAALIDHHPDSGDLYQAALCSPDGRTAAQRKIASLSFTQAAHVWQYSHIWSKKRPELAAELLPVILAAPADTTDEEPPGDARYERPSIIQSLTSHLPPEARLELLASPVYGRLLQRTFLDDKMHKLLTDEELVACVPEITHPQKDLPAGTVPNVIQYVQRFPRLADLAQPQLEQAVTGLIADGWSPVQCARAGQWDALMYVARITEAASVLDELAQASVHDRDGMTGLFGSPRQQRWHDPRRYDLVERLLSKALLPETAASHILDRLGDSEVDDIAASATPGSGLDLLCAAALQRRPSRALPTFRDNARHPEKLPSDEDLSRVDDPQAVLLDLIKSRDADRIQHALSSAYITDDLAWRVPAKTLASHPVYGPRLAAHITEICGDSPARWREFSSAWRPPVHSAASFEPLQTPPQGVVVSWAIRLLVIPASRTRSPVLSTSRYQVPIMCIMLSSNYPGPLPGLRDPRAGGACSYDSSGGPEG